MKKIVVPVVAVISLVLGLACAMFACQTSDSLTTATADASTTWVSQALVTPREIEFDTPATPPKVDLRTPMQIAADACNGRCRGTMISKPTTAVASAAGPIIPTSWTIPAWDIDLNNVLGCALDTNSGTAATCTGGCVGATCPSGIGPLRTFQELYVHRWGCQGGPNLCPRNQQATLITFLSGPSAATDPISLLWQNENAGLSITCTPTAVCSGATLSGVVTMVPDSGVVNQATITCDAGTVTTQQLIVDSTNPSGFWTWAVGDGGVGNFKLTTPLAGSAAGAYVPGTAATVGAEVTIANSDAVTVYSLPSINLVNFSPQNEMSTSPVNSSISNCAIAGATLARDPVIIGGTGQGIPIVNSSSTKLVVSNRNWTRAGQAWLNNDFEAAILQEPNATTTTASAADQGIVIIGGALGSFVSGGRQITLNNVWLDGDIILGSTSNNHYELYNSGIGSAYLDATAGVNTFGYLTLNKPGGVAPLSRIWGGGQFNVVTGTVFYPSGAGKAALTFTGGVTIQANGTTTNSCSYTLGGSLTTCTLPITAAQFDTSLGATSGCNGFLMNLGSYCNFGL